MSSNFGPVESSATEEILDEISTTYNPHEGSTSPPLFGKIVLSVVCAFGLAGNCLIIIQYIRCRTLRSAPNLFIINLAVADLSFQICLGPLVSNMVAHNGRMGYGELGCTIHAFATVLCAGTSVFSMGLIAVSRYVVIVHPQKKHLLSWRLCGILCGCSWVYTVLIILPALLGWGRLGWAPRSYICVYDWAYNIHYNILGYIFGFFVISATIFYCYYKIFKAFRESKRRVMADGAKGRVIQNDELRLAIQLLVVYAIYNIYWTPYLAMCQFIDPQGEGPEWLYCIFLILVFWNSAVNVLVYLYYNRVFRVECFKLFGLKHSKDTSVLVSGSSRNATKSTRTSPAHDME